MKIALIIWFLGGIILNLYGEIADSIRKDIRDLWDYSSDAIVKGYPQNKKWKIVAVEVTMRLFVVVFFPVVLIILIIDHYRDVDKNKRFEKETQERIKKEKEEKKKEEEEIKRAVIETRSFVYIKNLRGTGVIKCHGCCYSEHIIVNAHGYDNPCPMTMGYQCQSCGKFQTIEFLGNERVSSDRCHCGGELSNDRPVFCPQCKARDVTYSYDYEYLKSLLSFID